MTDDVPEKVAPKDGDPTERRRPRRARRRRAGTPAIEPKVLVGMSAGFFFITSILLWSGAVIAVRCDRVAAGRVDVTVEQRLLGLVPIRVERLTDVVRATSFQQTHIRRRAGAPHVGAQIRLTMRDGSEWESLPSAIHLVGTRPHEMAKHVQAFLDRPSDAPLELRWIPWLMSVLAVPFLLISGLFAMACVNVLRVTFRRAS